MSMGKSFFMPITCREKQLAYNKKHGITPKTIEKSIRNILEEFGLSASTSQTAKKARNRRIKEIARLDMLGDGRTIEEIIKDKQKNMKEAAQNLEFEVAAILRDEIRELEARKKVEGKREKKKKS
ncbi:MAG: UvrABC system protein B [Candidatus Magasanikbacteria bacterium GW2011_GWC2_42_27]|nr:MAG: UvrABC system protein B [Candidatus Magasanikbacteria bacterium GW2011_GWC2_42_27]